MLLWFVVLLLLIISAKTKRIADDSCLRLYPQTGSWSEKPPYWFPDDCPPTKVFSVEETVDCMKGRTIYAIGNSVPRQMIFGLLELVGGTKINREGQRDACPKHETFWGDSCHNEFAGVKLRYLFLQFMDGYHYANRSGFPFYNWTAPTQLRGTPTKEIYKKYPDKPTGPDLGFWEEDNCINQNMRGCLQKFFEGSTERDILIFNLGGAYCTKHFMENWLIASASNFRAHIGATFKGTVFHFTNAQTLKYYAYQTDCYKKVDDILWNIWYPMSLSDDETMTNTSTRSHEQWYTIDQWAINENRNHLYNDHIHYVGPLTQATLYQVLNRVCPNLGQEVVVKKTAVTLKQHIIQIINDDKKVTTSYVVDESGYLHETTDKCVELWSTIHHHPVSTMSNSQVDALIVKEAVSSPNIDVCIEGALLRPGNQRQVYELQNHRLVPLTYNDFVSKGLEFDNVRGVPDFVYAFYTPK